MKTEIIYDNLLEKVSNKYILTIIAGKRMRDINKGEPVLVKINKKDTLMAKAFKEILEGKISYGYEENISEEE